METKSNFIDFYLKHPIWLDSLLVIVLFFTNYFVPKVFTIKYGIDTQLNILSSLIGTSVSLAGFILAALTIIVAFKSNIASKIAQEASNPLELLFSTSNYSKVVKVFKDAIIELTVVFIGLYVIWVMLENFSSSTLLNSNIYGALLIFLAVLRTLFVLFLVLDLDGADGDPDE